MNQAPDLTAPSSTLQSAAPVQTRRTRSLLVPLIVLLLLATWLVARSGIYTPGSDFGYYLGVVGGLMMLALLLYPLRKHLRFLQNFGAVRHWFRLHMLFGIGGPLLILLHSTYYIGSLNAGVAMFCMLLVAGSGVVGRFFYTRIHHGLYGRKATLEEHRQGLGNSTSEVQSKLHYAPEVERRLLAFADAAQKPTPGLLAGLWLLLSMSWRARWVRNRCRRDLRKAMLVLARARKLPRDAAQREYRRAKGIIASYLEAVRDAAQFSIYERLFSLWHVLHVPFVFMLVVSGVVHVVAVHMY
jgi:hypothetical protein